MTLGKYIALLSLVLAVLGSQGSKPIYTQVTFLYDIKRGEIPLKGFSIGFPGKTRNYQQYLKYFEFLLLTDANLIIFGNKDLYQFVWQRRDPHNTVFILKQIGELKNKWFQPYVKRLRRQKLQDPNFSERNHIAFQLDEYNVLMFSKLYLLEQAIQHDKFNSDYFIWTDGGFNHVYPNENLYYPQNYIKKAFQLFKPQWIFFTFRQENMFRGYANNSMPYVGQKVIRIIWGGLYGGQIEAVRDARCAFQNLLRLTLENGDMYSDECVLSMMPYKYPFLFPIQLDMTAAYLKEISEKSQLFMKYHRRHQSHRLFMANFDDQGRILVVENRTQTKILVSTQEVVSQLPKEPSQTQLRCHYQAYSFFLLVGEHRNLYKQMFIRETALLLLLMALYLIARSYSHQLATGYDSI